MLEAFEELRPLLFSIAYGMLGNVMEAEDILQEAYLRLQDVDPAAIDSVEAYARTVVTRLCLDYLKSARVQRENYIGTWLPTPVVTDNATPETHLKRMESISMAFLVLLEQLSPPERAVFLMREAFDYEYGEIAAILGRSESACRKLYSRAKKHLTDGRPRFEISNDQHQALMQRFMATLQSGEVQPVMDLLNEEIAMYSDGGGKVPSVGRVLKGRDIVARFLLGITRIAARGDYELEFTTINGDPGMIARDRAGHADTVMICVFEGEKVKTLYFVRNPDKLAHLNSTSR